MFATAEYRVLQEFTYLDVVRYIDDVLTLKDADGEPLVQQGKLVVVRFLDADDPTDAATIADVETAAAALNTTQATAEAARSDRKAAELAAEDQ